MKTTCSMLLISFLIIPNAFAQTIFTDISSSIAGRGVSAIGDVNRDGKVDFLHSKGISLNLGNSSDGKPSFEFKQDGLDFVYDALSHSILVDIDGDGDEDLIAVERFGGAKLYRNDSCGTNLRFVDITSEVGLGGGLTNEQTHIALADIDADGDLDLYITEGWPAGNKGILYRNDTTAAGVIHFTDITAKSGIIAPKGCRTILFTDFDKDGDVDIYLGSHGDWAKFYLNMGDTDGDGIPNFVDASSASGLRHAAYDNGATAGDIDNDGDIDIIQATAPGDAVSPFQVYLNSGDLNGDGIVDFIKSPNSNGLSITTGHGVGLGDVDNDGDLDLADASFHQSPLRFYGNNGNGTFTDITAASGIGYLTYGVKTLFADIDNDGDLDLWMNKLFLNNANNANYLKVRLLGEGFNRDAVGARLRVWGSGKSHDAANLVAYREVTAGTAFFASDDYVLELGLPAGNYDLEATFVKGAKVSLNNISTGQTVNIQESDSVYIPQPGYCGGINHPPIAVADAKRIVSCASAEGAEVSLDGSQSSDPDKDTLTYLWKGPFDEVTGASPVVRIPLGTYPVTLTVDDGKGLTSRDTIAITVGDNQPPATSIVSIAGNAGNNGWYLSNIVANLVSIDNCSGVKEIRSNIDDGGETVTAGSSASIPLDTDGSHTVNYYAKDNAGNVEEKATLTINIDKTPPIITAHVSPMPNAAGWYNADVTVTFTCSDSGSGIAECPAPVAVTTEGAGQVITGTAVDRAGNSASTSISVNIDKSVPEGSISLSQGVLWPPNHKMVNIAVNGGALDYSSGIASVVFTVKDEYGYIEPVVQGFNTTIPLEAWREGADMDGRHYWITAEITDMAGNKTTVTTEAVVPHDMSK